MVDNSDLHWQCQLARLIPALQEPSLLCAGKKLKATGGGKIGAKRMEIGCDEACLSR